LNPKTVKTVLYALKKRKFIPFDEWEANKKQIISIGFKPANQNFGSKTVINGRNLKVR